MSLGRTMISLWLLRESDVLNDENTYWEEQKRVFIELKWYYSNELVILLQDMMNCDETDRCESYKVFSRLGKLFIQNGLHRYDGLENIPVAPEIPQPDIKEDDDPVNETFGRGE